MQRSATLPLTVFHFPPGDCLKIPFFLNTNGGVSYISLWFAPHTWIQWGRLLIPPIVLMWVGIHDTAFLSLPLYHARHNPQLFLISLSSWPHDARPSPLTAPKARQSSPRSFSTTYVTVYKCSYDICFTLPDFAAWWWWRVADGYSRQTELWTLVLYIFCLLVTVLRRV